MEPKDLCIPSYLNQAIVFDMLAIIDDGFTNVTTIKAANTSVSSSNVGVEAKADASLGIKNIFSLFSIGINGKYGHSSGSENGKEESFEKVHTPTSLFWKLREYLISKNALLTIEDGEMPKIDISDFVEIEAVFHQNPIIEGIDNIKRLLDLALVLSPESLQGEQKQNPGGGKTQKHSSTTKPPIIEQVDAIRTALTIDDSIDLIATTSKGINLVIPCDKNYFVNENANRVVDGRYKVLGKVVNYFPSEGSSISLLRTTSFSRFNKDFFMKMFSGFAGMSSAGINLPEIKIEIKGPCLQIIPIGIFI
jgi:hypothetical protein